MQPERRTEALEPAPGAACFLKNYGFNSANYARTASFRNTLKQIGCCADDLARLKHSETYEMIAILIYTKSIT
jgi:hypothetical protein